MFGHIVVGATGTGKTTFVKNLIKKVKNERCLFIYDVNAEYRDIFPYELVHFEDFADKARRVRQKMIVFEEATIFLDARSRADKHVKDILVRKRHTKNYIVLVFHSFSQIPNYILKLCNYVTIFKTLDSENFVFREFKHEKLATAMKQVNENSKDFYNKTIKLY